jgi:Lon protease-like protein
MLEEPLRDFPLFPLGIVALPGEAVPLHIFEHRYREMIESCLRGRPGAHGGEFGIVWLSKDGLRDVGCTCAVEQVLERMDDGRMNILARGGTRFRIIERQDDLRYPAGVVELLADVRERTDRAAAAAARERYSELVLEATDRRLEAEELAGMDAYGMAGTVELEPQAKQQLLELDSENARLELLASLLSEAIERVREAERAELSARSNGRVHLA